MLITFANSLDPDQDQWNIGPDLGSKLFDTLIVFLKEFLEKVNFEKSQLTTIKARKTRAAVDGTPSQIPAFLPITFTLGSMPHKM